MGETTGITWTDHTFNPWIGCTKVSQGCKLCYAETQNNRYKWNPAGWGPGAPRKLTSAANWKKPLEWARAAVRDGVTRRVFCASLADVFDPEVDNDWRMDLWELVEATSEIGGLEWLILTKRPENITPHTIFQYWLDYPPQFLRIGITGEDQENYCKRYTALRKVWKGKNFVSYEPALGPLVIGEKCHVCGGTGDAGYGDCPGCGGKGGDFDKVDWLICGGESGAGCRPFDIEWARSLKRACRDAGIPFFMKQLGGHPNKRHDPAEWPADLRVQEFPA